MNCARVAKRYNVQLSGMVVSSIRSDIAKAIAAGADTVMLEFAGGRWMRALAS